MTILAPIWPVVRCDDCYIEGQGVAHQNFIVLNFIGIRSVPSQTGRYRLCMQSKAVRYDIIPFHVLFHASSIQFRQEFDFTAEISIAISFSYEIEWSK